VVPAEEFFRSAKNLAGNAFAQWRRTGGLFSFELLFCGADVIELRPQDGSYQRRRLLEIDDGLRRTDADLMAKRHELRAA
jgi:hypothetical protein